MREVSDGVRNVTQRGSCRRYDSWGNGDRATISGVSPSRKIPRKSILNSGCELKSAEISREHASTDVLPLSCDLRMAMKGWCRETSCVPEREAWSAT